MIIPWKFIEVEWEDASSSVTWEEEDTLPTPHVCISRGWLVKDELDFIVLCSTLDTSHAPSYAFSESIAIPRGCITGLHEITPTYPGPLVF